MTGAVKGADKNRRNQVVGRWGEALAAEYLQQHGYALLEQNARTKYGEIDLVVCPCHPPGEPAEFTVFVEVKTRRSTRFGLPEAAVTPSKREHLLNAAQAYLLAHPELPGNWRVDVIAILKLPGAPPEIIHFENALT